MWFDPVQYPWLVDPRYLELVVAPALLVLLVVGVYVHVTVSRWEDVPLLSGLSGAEVAAALLRDAGVEGVRIEISRGFLSDHYHPARRVLALSRDVFHGRSVTAAAVAAHEAGHAIQHAERFKLMRVHQALVRPSAYASQMGLVLIVLGLVIERVAIAWLGVALLATIVLYQLVRLRLELDASTRARTRLESAGMVDPVQATGVSEVLTAAALTYLASVATTAIELAYWVSQVHKSDE